MVEIMKTTKEGIAHTLEGEKIKTYPPRFCDDCNIIVAKKDWGWHDKDEEWYCGFCGWRK